MHLGEMTMLLPMEPDRVEEFWQSFRDETESDDLDHFLAWLYEHRHVGSETFRALHGHGQLSLVTLDELLQGDDDDDLDDRFTTLGVLGKGAMGLVHIARERDLRRKVALKVLLEQHANNEDIVRRFFREVQITAWLDHPNIVPVYSLEVDDDGAPACAMKLIQGITLRKWLQEAGDLADAGTMDDAHGLTARLDIFLKICDAIAYSHSKGILHRDLKPSNVMIGPFGEVYVMDWGIARPLRFDDGEQPDDLRPVLGPFEGGEDDAGIFATQYGTVVGTPHYMSPEQAQGRTDLEGRSDLYSLGLILHELITLEPAIAAESVEDALDEAALGKLGPLTWPEPTGAVPPELAAVVGGATALEPEDRYPGVADLAEDLRRYLRGEAVRVSPDTAMQALVRWVGRNREKTVALLAVGLVLILGIATYGLIHERQAVAEAQAREEALGAALTDVATRAATIDREFLRYEGLLEGLAASAMQALNGPDPSDIAVLLDDDFADPDRAPADLAHSDRFGKPVSTSTAVQVLAPGVDRAAVAPHLRRMASIGPGFGPMVVRSDPTVTNVLTGDEIRARVTGEGVPVVWAYVATEEGVHTAWPGKAGYPDGYDPRQRPWYQLAANEFGPRCGNPYLDSQGQGLLLPCALSMFDREQAFRGVAGIDLTFDTIVDRLLELDRPGVRESFLLDEQARVIIRSGYQEQTPPVDPSGKLAPPRFDSADAVDSMLDGGSGYVETADGTLIAWYRLSALGWFYVVEADAGGLLAGRAHDG
ncbi:MAG: protein kinase [Proteobacteria bacterium]|nr:protein kinase [Pseudomonadota bacterium]